MDKQINNLIPFESCGDWIRRFKILTCRAYKTSAMSFILAETIVLIRDDVLIANPLWG